MQFNIYCIKIIKWRYHLCNSNINLRIDDIFLFLNTHLHKNVYYIESYLLPKNDIFELVTFWWRNFHKWELMIISWQVIHLESIWKYIQLFILKSKKYKVFHKPYIFNITEDIYYYWSRNKFYIFNQFRSIYNFFSLNWC